MKIAIFHNALDNIGGAEYVDLILARQLPADIYTTNIDRPKIEAMGFNTKRIFSIGSIPINAPFRQEAIYRRFKKLNLGRRYDGYVIAGDWAIGGAKHNRPNWWYVYSPTRELWDLYPYVRQNLVPAWQRSAFDLWVWYRRKKTLSDLAYVNKLIAISDTVRERVKKYLHRQATVIYPPVETAKYGYHQNGDFWLSVNRLVKHKRIELQLAAFKRLPEKKLIIVGSYEKAKHFTNYANYLRKIKPPNVKILSWVTQTELIQLYAQCRGLITTSLDEDFGLTPLEAMASGKPVIAPNEGGYRETIIHQQTGILINNLNADKLINTIKQLEKNPARFKSACLNQAKKFDTCHFINQFKKEITNGLN